MASLRELQRSFAAALRDPSVACPVLPPANLAIYRNNAHRVFENALEIGFPVLRRRVGDEYFRQLVFHFRARNPSRSGDLHGAGHGFAGFLDEHLAGGDYAWLADLARLEWAREEVSVLPELNALGAAALAGLTPEQLEDLQFGFQPSLRLVSSPYPVFSVWFANQGENAAPVDQSKGSEQGLVRIQRQTVEVAHLPHDLFSYLSALAGGATLGEAMTATGVEAERLTSILGYLFSSGLISSLRGQRVGTSS